MDNERAYLQVFRRLSHAMRYLPDSVSQQPSLGLLVPDPYGVFGYCREVGKGSWIQETTILRLLQP